MDGDHATTVTVYIGVTAAISIFYKWLDIIATSVIPGQEVYLFGDPDDTTTQEACFNTLRKKGPVLQQSPCLDEV